MERFVSTESHVMLLYRTEAKSETKSSTLYQIVIRDACHSTIFCTNWSAMETVPSDEEAFFLFTHFIRVMSEHGMGVMFFLKQRRPLLLTRQEEWVGEGNTDFLISLIVSCSEEFQNTHLVLLWFVVTLVFYGLETQTMQHELFHSFLETIHVIIRLKSRYCFPIVDFR